MSKSNNNLKKALDDYVYKENPFNEESKEKIKYAINNVNSRRNYGNNSLLASILTVGFTIGTLLGVGTLTYNSIQNENPNPNPNQVIEINKSQSASKDNVKTYKTYGISPENLGVNVLYDKEGFYSIAEEPFGPFESIPTLQFLDTTRIEYIMTGKEIDEIHREFPTTDVIIPVGIYYEEELIQIAITINSKDNSLNKEKVLDFFKEKYIQNPVIINFTELVPTPDNQMVFKTNYIGYMHKEYTYIQSLKNSMNMGNINTLIDWTKNGKPRFVGNSSSLYNLEMWEREYKTMTFDGYFYEDGINGADFPEAKNDPLLAGKLGIVSEVPMDIANQKEQLTNIILELETYYGRDDFALKVIYRNDDNYIEGKNIEEYGGWSIAYKLPKNSNILFYHFKGKEWE